jgi:hypothetical protein
MTLDLLLRKVREIRWRRLRRVIKCACFPPPLCILFIVFALCDGTAIPFPLLPAIAVGVILEAACW